jgi:hypothetical protein
MLVRLRWIVIDQAAGHHEVSADELGDPIRQATQLAPDRSRQLVGGDVGRELDPRATVRTDSLRGCPRASPRP